MLSGKLGQTKIGILTITDEEFAAAQRIFGASQNIPGSSYFVAAGSNPGQYEIVVRQSADRTNTPASRATAAFIQDLRPAFIFLVGTAGGVLKDEVAGTGRDGTRLGDVVAADFIDYTEFIKMRGRKNLERKVPHDHPSLYLRESFAAPLRGSAEWHPWIGEPRPVDGDPPRVIIGNVAAGEKIFSSPRNPYQKYVVAKFDKALAFETEAFGVALQVFSARCSVHYNPQFLVIRGLSDFVNSADADGTRRDWTPYAASAALAFARCVAQKLLADLEIQSQALKTSERSVKQKLSDLYQRFFGKGSQ